MLIQDSCGRAEFLMFIVVDRKFIDVILGIGEEGREDTLMTNDYKELGIEDNFDSWIIDLILVVLLLE